MPLDSRSKTPDSRTRSYKNESLFPEKKSGVTYPSPAPIYINTGTVEWKSKISGRVVISDIQ